MLSFIGNQFKKPTGLFGKLVSHLMQKGNSYAYQQIIPELAISENDKIFEIGYGHGLGVDMMVTTYNCNVSGIDFSELMYHQATKRNQKHIRQKKVDLYFGDFLQHDILPDYYDKIFCINVIYFWDKLDVPFAKIHAGLKKGGTFSMFMAHRDDLERLKFTKDDIFTKYTIEVVVDKLKQQGFENITYNFDKGYFIKCIK